MAWPHPTTGPFFDQWTHCFTLLRFDRAFVALFRIAANALFDHLYLTSLTSLTILRFDRAFVALFRIAAGDTWIDTLPTLDADGQMQVLPRSGSKWTKW